VADSFLTQREEGVVFKVVCSCTGNVTGDSSGILNANGTHGAVG
jgi:hypothetical protein